MKNLTIFNRLHKQGINDQFTIPIIPCPEHLKTDIETITELWTEHKYNLPITLNGFNTKKVS